jgi:hypothetical protein
MAPLKITFNVFKSDPLKKVKRASTPTTNVLFVIEKYNS